MQVCAAIRQLEVHLWPKSGYWQPLATFGELQQKKFSPLAATSAVGAKLYHYPPYGGGGCNLGLIKKMRKNADRNSPPLPHKCPP
jgi:hypothetical protein